MRQADRFDQVDETVGAVEIAHLDGGSQRREQRHALEFDRQRGNRAIDVLENGLRLRPFAEAGVGDRAPDRRVELVADARIGQFLERLLGPLEHHVGDPLEHGAGDVVGRALLGERDVEHGLGLRRHLAGEIEAREIEARLFAVGFRRHGGDLDQFRLPGVELGGAVIGPELGVEAQAARIAGELRLADRGRRQREPLRTGDGDFVLGKLGRDVVGERLQHHAVG